MFKNLIDGSGLMDLPVLGMLFFIAVFVAVVVRVLSRRRGEVYDRMARLPLEESEEVTS